MFPLYYFTSLLWKQLKIEITGNFIHKPVTQVRS